MRPIIQAKPVMDPAPPAMEGLITMVPYTPLLKVDILCTVMQCTVLPIFLTNV